MRYRLLHPCLLVAVLGLMGASAWAVDCRMPNGKVVSFRSMSACPPDASQLDADGKVVRGPLAKLEKPAGPSPAPPTQEKRPVETHVVQPRQFKVLDAAHAMCGVLRSKGAASQCKVEVNVLSPSTIDVTTLDNPRLAFSSCVELAKQLRQLAPADARASAWEIRLFSPFSGDRPTGTCTL